MWLMYHEVVIAKILKFNPKPESLNRHSHEGIN